MILICVRVLNVCVVWCLLVGRKRSEIEIRWHSAAGRCVCVLVFSSDVVIVTVLWDLYILWVLNVLHVYV